MSLLRVVAPFVKGTVLFRTVDFDARHCRAYRRAVCERWADKTSYSLDQLSCYHHWSFGSKGKVKRLGEAPRRRGLNEIDQ